MYIHKISIHNIRGFAHLEFDLRRPNGDYAGWTVFTGDNGAGKSTLLKVIALSLLDSDSPMRLLSAVDGWIRRSPTEEIDHGYAELELLFDPGQDQLLEPGHAAMMPAPGADGYVHSTVLPTFKKSGKNGTHFFYNSHDHAALLFNESIAARNGCFSCGYGPFRRIFGASPDAIRLMQDDGTERFVTMFFEAASLFECDQWLRNLRYKELEGNQEAAIQLELVLALLRDDLLPEHISIERVDSDGLWLKDAAGALLTWQDMSDGYRSAVAMLIDILRHMAQAFGVTDLATMGSDGRYTIQKSGVVLIDEVDAHLHPEWQRRIGFWLKKHFPKIQFLVSTHSPLICQAADENGLFVLPPPASGLAPYALSRDEYFGVAAARPDTILLSKAFGLENTRSDQAIEKRTRYAQLRARERANLPLALDEQCELEMVRLWIDRDVERDDE